MKIYKKLLTALIVTGLLISTTGCGVLEFFMIDHDKGSSGTQELTPEEFAEEYDFGEYANELAGLGSTDADQYPELSETSGFDQSAYIYENWAPLTFTTQDLDGNTVDETIFENAELTLVTYFEDWCTWCVKEMPHIQELYEKYGADGSFQIVGVCTVDDFEGANFEASDVESVRAILDENNITFPVIRNCAELDCLVEASRPECLFVDSCARVLTLKDFETYVDMRVCDWKEYFTDDELYSVLSEDNIEWLNDVIASYDSDKAAFVEEFKSEYEGEGGNYDYIAEELLSGYHSKDGWEILIKYFLGL